MFSCDLDGHEVRVQPGDLFEAEQRGLGDGGDRGAHPPVLDVTLVPAHLDRHVSVVEMCRDVDHYRDRGLTPIRVNSAW